MQFPLEECLSGKLSEETMAKVVQRYTEENVAEKEPPGGAQNDLQCYVRAQVVSDKVSFRSERRRYVEERGSPT